jgi:hypothetical protein
MAIWLDSLDHALRQVKRHSSGDTRDRYAPACGGFPSAARVFSAGGTIPSRSPYQSSQFSTVRLPTRRNSVTLALTSTQSVVSA